MLKLCIDRAQVPGCQGLQQVWVDQQNLIQAIHPLTGIESPLALSHLDLEEDWLSLGGVDLQINGALGLAFPDLTEADQPKLQEIGQLLWRQGVDGYLPTVVTTAVEKIHRALAVVNHGPSSSTQPTAKILGVHLEGPCLNFEKRGAHPAEYLRPLTISDLQQVLGPHADVVKVMTLAPELDVEGDAISYLCDRNIIVSLGHSQATAEQAEAAFHKGATMVTHAFNAMPSLHHRQPGLLAAALVKPKVWCGFIADGQHIDPLMLKLLLQASPERLFLVSDALSPLGLPDGVYPWDTRQIEVKNGTARLPDGTLSGTTLSLLQGVQNLVRWRICSVEQAIALATEAPRKAIGLPGIGLGQPASALLRWHQNPKTGDLSWKRLLADASRSRE
ncbi:N-acetylglucosamine-6-phosphate deacetylase [Acaryochloris thomasi RCC1774]|uniref:N-acetylglucosamine-6-phosphate deacetylase n=1 Tax=Acaryochloris thomasi RCC1774 TaxID=1764569 RepID=A0A2W1JYN2_9CYAN|nr:N-acetylglucosamine-6-phosphate deacetylase [Acaryochloris thomasi]PZD74594.1 N-acetylglucosamine-6-phosphate deacetylase [Acaryochloris thomasi RCC1774]